MKATLTPHEFVDKWKQVTVKERSGYQEHFIDLCRLVGQPTPIEADPTGQSYTFEAGAAIQGGGNGWADVWRKGFFALEYKGKHANLDKAYDQLLLYRESLQNPPLLIVCDLERIIIHTNFTNTVKRVITLELDDILTTSGFNTLKAVFDDPESFRATKTTEDVTQDAAKNFSRLADLLRRYGTEAHTAAHFLIRVLFCLFAEDVGLLPKNLFRKLVENTVTRPKQFTQSLRSLFAQMASGGMFGVDTIPHFNGGLFDDDAVIELDSDSLRILLSVSALDWGSIEPSIFGTLFERSLDPTKRAQLGAHYTSFNDIMLIVKPVLMQPLLRRWEEVQAIARELAAKRDALPPARRRLPGETRQFNKFMADLQTLLKDFQNELSGIRVFDPACGSGNFLYVALRELLNLEKQVVTFGGEVGMSGMFPQVSPLQLFGIEINPYAYELAQTTVWIGYIQWLGENGFGAPPEPILKQLNNIANKDAILHLDVNGKATESEWPEADVIIGNPPFLGDKKMRSELGDVYVNALRTLFKDRIPGQSDLVCYWFEKAREQIELGKVKRAGLIATQGIRGGANRKVLERIKETGDIFFAWSDRDWILDGATVHVSVVAFDKGFEKSRLLDFAQVSEINADLSSAANVASAHTLDENQGLSFIGVQRNGPFDIADDLAVTMLEATGNPNGQSNSEVIKPWINALDVVQVWRKMWIIDFGVNRSMEDSAQFEAPFEYVLQRVKPLRDKVNRKNHREKWWLFGETRPGMRQAIGKLAERYIVTPMVSKYRIFSWVNKKVIPENLLVVIARDDDYFFGVLHSKIHEVWARSQGTQLREAESGQRYTPSTTFVTFAFPWSPGQEPQNDQRVKTIALAAKNLVDKRDNWLQAKGKTGDDKLRTLTNLYNDSPTWLQIAHQKLDHAVLDAYGWPHNLTDEQILERLLALNLERSAQQK